MSSAWLQWTFPWWRFKRCRRGALASPRAGHSTQKRCLSSTCHVLHDLHNPLFLLGGRYIYQFQFVVVLFLDPLNRASRDLWDFTLTFCTYSSVFPYSVLKFTNLWFGWNLSLPHLSFPGDRNSRRLHAGVHCVRVHHRSSGATSVAGHNQLKFAWLDLPSSLGFVLL